MSPTSWSVRSAVSALAVDLAWGACFSAACSGAAAGLSGRGLGRRGLGGAGLAGAGLASAAGCSAMAGGAGCACLGAGASRLVATSRATVGIGVMRTRASSAPKPNRPRLPRLRISISTWLRLRPSAASPISVASSTVLPRNSSPIGEVIDYFFFLRIFRRRPADMSLGAGALLRTASLATTAVWLLALPAAALLAVAWAGTRNGHRPVQPVANPC